MLKIGFVQCYGTMQPTNAEPLSVEVLAGVMQESLGSKVKSEIFTLSEQENNSCTNLKNYIVQENIKIIGISIPQSCLKIATDFLAAIYLQDRSRLIVLGHSLPTHLPELFLRQFPESLIVRGWGEESFTEIVNFYLAGRKDYEKIPNLVFKRNEQIVKTEIKWPVASPKPMRLPTSFFFTRVESSRGCHYDVCTFCTRQPIQSKAKRWHRFDIDDITKELSNLKNLGIKNFTFTDEDFIGDDLEGAEKIADHLIKLKDMKFSISLRVDNIINPDDPHTTAKYRSELINKFKSAGLSLVFLGVESFSNSQLKRYGKGLRTDDSINSIRALHQINIPVEIGFILFDPFLTLEELEENIHWLQISSAWHLVGQLYNHMRIQINTPMANLMKVKGLLGKLNPDTIDFEYQYYDNTIGQIAHFCITWKENIDKIYSLARNNGRNKFKNDACNKFVQEIKKLQINLLTTVLSNYRNQNKLVFPETRKKERELIQKLYMSILKDNETISKPAMQELKKSIESHLEKLV